MRDYSQRLKLKEDWTLKELPYKKVNFKELKNKTDELCDRVSKAQSYEEVRECIFENSDILSELYYTEGILTIKSYDDVTNEFYDNELSEFLEEKAMFDKSKFGRSLLNSKYKEYINKEFGSHYLKKIAVDADIHKNGRELMAEEQKLIGEYQQMKYMLRFNFDNKELSEDELKAYFVSSDRDVRRESYRTLLQVYKSKSQDFFRILHELVKVRNQIAKENGFDNYLDYADKQKDRVGYGEKELASFCEQIKADLVPFYEKIFKAQSEHIGVDKLCLYDAQYLFSDGNPKPAGDAKYLLNAAKYMYEDMSDKSGEIFDYMLRHELNDVMPSKNKASGFGLCTELGILKGCAIFADFNGTSEDVIVLTHEVGHAMQGYMTFEKQNIFDCCDIGDDIAEISSKIMEQFAYPYAEKFFGKDAEKYKYAHMQECLVV